MERAKRDKAIRMVQRTFGRHCTDEYCIEWIEEKNFGALEESEDEEMLWQFGLINVVNFDGLIGILGIVTAWKSDQQVIRPFFISKDTSLTLTWFETIDDNIAKFIQSYKHHRPKEKKIEWTSPFKFFTIITESEEE